MPLRSLTTLAAAALVVVLALPTPAAAAPSPTDSLVARLATTINEVRAKRDLSKLSPAPRLTRAAERHATSMSEFGYFSHDLWTPARARDWTPFGAWIRWYWPGRGHRPWSAGENLFCSSYAPSAREVVRGWMGSPAHRAILFTRRWRNLGVAAVRSTDPAGVPGCGANATIVAAEFGRRS